MSENWLNTVNIRLIREEDLPALEWDGEYKRYRKIYREVYRRSQQGIAMPFVAETVENGIIGQVVIAKKEANPAVGYKNRYYFLSSFRIKPDFRGRGLGHVMLERCFREVKARKVREIILNCASDNNRARHFYEKHGFRIIRLDEGNWTYVDDEGYVVTEPQSAYVMRKSLRWGLFGK